ncbi:MAG: hypothetical protein D6696_17905 [Acidobacteria bacterium]|nr:MAG: hypothetical protein D6696_17905 [Acidobacteriota bacterium]
MKIYKVLPDLSRTRHMKIWHKALRSQWSAADVDWQKPQRITRRSLKDQLGRMLTPVLMGEQAALYSVSSLIPILGQNAEVESQLYLTTWAVDEGRHTELFTRFYHRLDREPMSIRRFPAGYLFQSQIVSKDVVEWLSGVLISEVLAKLVMEGFRRLDLDPVLSEIADGILVDEARHLGFNHIYVEDKFSRLGTPANGEADALAAHLHDRLSRVLEKATPMIEALRDDLIGIGFDPDELYHDLEQEARMRLQKAIDSGRRIAAGQAEVSDPRQAEAIGA